ncbi:hypothetical protein Q1695_010976 [Nippostrongylus brasiliensis]|nr:hypothetical protein Q1695_010976 [Nippostrongylus brasiliensis]
MVGFNVFSCDAFDIVDESFYYKDLYREMSVQMDPQLFAINGPFMMDSQFEAMKKEDRRVRKRKRNECSLSKEVAEEIATIEELSCFIREEGFRIGYFGTIMEKDNNRQARDKAKNITEHRIDLYRPEAIVSYEIIDLTDNSDFIIDDEFCMLNSWYTNSTDRVIRLNVSERRGETPVIHYIPPGATFHVGSVTDVRNFAAINGNVFDFILMDPPWENLSVRRQQSYVTSASPLSSVNLECLERGGLVAVWITNKKGIEKELTAFFQRWNLCRVATLFWLKVTLEGQPICSFNSSHKLPYEKLVLATHSGYAECYEAIASADGKVVVSVPMAVPSRKPPILPLLKQHGFVPGRCLELFARSLLPNTVSVGFEPLLLQSAHCLILTEKEETFTRNSNGDDDVRTLVGQCAELKIP